MLFLLYWSYMEVFVNKQPSLLSEFTKYVSLNILGMLGLSCYILADTFFVANGIGTDGLAALNLAIPVYSFIHGSGLMVGMGGATRYSIVKSQGSSESANKAFTQAAFFAALLSALFFMIGLFASNPLAKVLGADEVTLNMTKTYLQVILLFSPAFIFNNLFLCFVRNDDSPRLAMSAMLLGSLSNIILDYVFIFPCNMGMFGAAVATGIAPAISMSILSIHLARRKNNFHFARVKPSPKAVLDICALGVSSLITEFASGIVMIVMNILLLQLAGNTAVAAYGIVANLSLVIMSIFTGIAQGVQPLASTYYGQKNHVQVQHLSKYAILLSAIISILIYIVLNGFAEPVISLFNKENDLHLADMAKEGIQLYFTGFLFAGINIISAVKFSCIEQPKYSFSISLMRGFILIIPLAYLLSSLFGMEGIWLTFPAAEALTSVFVLAISLFLRKTSNPVPHQ